MPNKLLPYSRRQLNIMVAQMKAERGWSRWVTILLLEVA